MKAAEAKKETEAEPREFLALDVREVSLVDAPANRRRFLVVKRDEGENMGAFEQSFTPDPAEIGLPRPSKTEPTLVQKALGEDWQAVVDHLAAADGADELEVHKALSPELRASVEKVAAFVQKVAQGEPEPAESKPEGEPVEKAEGDVKPGGEGDSKPDAKPEGAPVEKADGDTQPDAKPESEKVEKAEGEQKPADEGEQKPDAPAVAVMPDGSVIVHGTPVQKAKGFTSSRTEILKTVISALGGLLQDVDPDGLKSIVGGFGKTPELPSTSSVTQEVKTEPASAAVSKAEEMVGKLTEQLEAVSKRLEKIEETRGPSKSADTGQGSDGQTVPTQKRNGLWSNIIA